MIIHFAIARSSQKQFDSVNNCKKIQYVGISDELHPMGKRITLSFII